MSYNTSLHFSAKLVCTTIYQYGINIIYNHALEILKHDNIRSFMHKHEKCLVSKIIRLKT